MNSFQIVKNKNHKAQRTVIQNSHVIEKETSIQIIDKHDIIQPEGNTYYIIKPDSSEDIQNDDFFHDLTISLFSPDKSVAFNIINISKNTRVSINYKQLTVDELLPDESLSILYVKELDKYLII